MIRKKKTSLLFTISLACLTVIIIPTITIPLVLKNKSNNQNSVNNLLIDSYKKLFASDSKGKINNLFFNNSRFNSNITKNQIKQSISFDKDTFLYKQVKQHNQNLDDLDNLLVDEIYQMYQEELKTQNHRCGSVFRKHFWLAIYMKGRALIINALSIAWWGIQIAPAVANFVINLDGAALADSLASFSFQLPNF